MSCSGDGCVERVRRGFRAGARRAGLPPGARGAPCGSAGRAREGARRAPRRRCARDRDEPLRARRAGGSTRESVGSRARDRRAREGRRLRDAGRAPRHPLGARARDAAARGGGARPPDQALRRRRGPARARLWILQVASTGAYQPSPTCATYSAARRSCSPSARRWPSSCDEPACARRWFLRRGEPGWRRRPAADAAWTAPRRHGARPSRLRRGAAPAGPPHRTTFRAAGPRPLDTFACGEPLTPRRGIPGAPLMG